MYPHHGKRMSLAWPEFIVKQCDLQAEQVDSPRFAILAGVLKTGDSDEIELNAQTDRPSAGA